MFTTLLLLLKRKKSNIGGRLNYKEKRTFFSRLFTQLRACKQLIFHSIFPVIRKKVYNEKITKPMKKKISGTKIERVRHAEKLMDELSCYKKNISIQLIFVCN
jgi:hypothetical protein